MKLIRQAAEILEQKQSAAEKPATNYAAFFGAGKGLFATPEEVDHFIRQERDANDDVFKSLGLPQIEMLSDVSLK